MDRLNELFDRLRALVAIPATSGFEQGIARRLANEMRPLADRVEVDAFGNVYVTASASFVRRIEAGTGTITTVGGYPSAGSFEGTGAAAGFAQPWGIAVDPYRSRIIVADTSNHALRVSEVALADEATIDVPLPEKAPIALYDVVTGERVDAAKHVLSVGENYIGSLDSF